MKEEPGKLIKYRVEECESGDHAHVTGVSVEDVTVQRSERGVRLVDKNGVTVGWSPAYAANWDANFGHRDPKPENEPENLN